MRFLSSYLVSLQSLELTPMDHIKGKQIPQKCYPHVQAAGNIPPVVLPSPWRAPIHGRVKLNTDGSVSNGTAGAGMILRDHEGAIIFK